MSEIDEFTIENRDKKRISYKIKHWLRYQLTPHLLPLIFNPKPSKHKGPIKRVVLLRPGKLGDMFVATPFFEMLKTKYAIQEIVVVCSKYNEIIIRNNPWVDNIKIINFHNFKDVKQLIVWLRKEKFCACIDLTPGYSRTNFYIASKLPLETLKIGILKFPIQKHYDKHFDPVKMHIVDRYIALGKFIFGETEFKPKPKFFLDNSALEQAKEFSKELPQDKLIIGINFSAGRKDRLWNYASYDELIQKLQTIYEQAHFLLFAIRDERVWAESIHQKCKNSTIVPSFPLMTIAKIVSFCKVMITPDTFIVHISAAQNVGIVGLYPPDYENYTRWKPFNTQHRVLFAKDMKSLNSIPSADVVTQARQLIDCELNVSNCI